MSAVDFTNILVLVFSIQKLKKINRMFRNVLFSIHHLSNEVESVE